MARLFFRKIDGDTLVVQTIGFRDDQWLDMGGTPMTDAAKLTERFRRPNYGHLEITTLNQFLVLNTELLDYICGENEKDLDTSWVNKWRPQQHRAFSNPRIIMKRGS